MKSTVPEVEKRAPLSHYLRAEDEDGWTVFSSDDAQTDVELAPRSERGPDLSVLKRIKNFLSDEAAQDGSFFASDEDGAPNFRVDYPFYDSCPEEEETFETSQPETNVCESDVKEESVKIPEPEIEQNAAQDSVETPSLEPKTPTDDDEAPGEPRNKKSNLKFTPVVLQAPETQTSAPSSPETPETPEPQTDEPSELETVVEECEKNDSTPFENTLEELVSKPCTEERAESEPVKTEDVPTSTNEESANRQTFVVDFSETLAPVLERRARGEELEELPLVQTHGRRPKRVKKESPTPTPPENEESLKSQTETSQERSEPFPFSRATRSANVPMAIFRRCVDLVSKRASQTSDASLSEKLDSAPSTPAFDSETPSESVPRNDDFGYGESVAYVAAPCFCDFGAVTTFATTFN